MLYMVDGNIFESPAQTLVNTVNTAGAMGKGLAKEFKRLFPDMFTEYQRLCESGSLDIGKLWLYPTKNKSVLNFPTKRHWRQPSKLEFIDLGLRTFVSVYDQARVTSIAFPQLGCGNGELDWAEVKPLMEMYLKSLPIDAYIYEVNRSTIPEHRNLKRMRQWLVNEPQSLPFDEFKRDIEYVISTHQTVSDSSGTRFRVQFDSNTTTFENGGVEVLPWHGDDTGSGWLQLWQFIRNKGACTTTDLARMGLPQPGLLMALLRKLDYIKPLKILDRMAIDAVRLSAPSTQGSFFSEKAEDTRTIPL